MKDENCYVDAFGQPSNKLQRYWIRIQENRRELQVFEQGSKVRQVQSLLDVDTWYYREEGTMQPWEGPAEYMARSKRKRLSVNALRRYFETFTAFKVPSRRPLASGLGLSTQQS
jgi:hypothetical protein